METERSLVLDGGSQLTVWERYVATCTIKESYFASCFLLMWVHAKCKKLGDNLNHDADCLVMFALLDRSTIRRCGGWQQDNVQELVLTTSLGIGDLIELRRARELEIFARHKIVFDEKVPSLP